MIYNEALKNKLVGTLKDRVSTLSSSTIAILEAGYERPSDGPNLLSWCSILIDAYQNIDIMSEEQHASIDNIYNKVINYE